MPRHPPCALHSLSHHTTNPHHPNKPTQKPRAGPTTRHGGDRRCTRNTPQRTNTHPPQSQRACTTNNQTRQPHMTHGSERCSRPLSRSQTTTPHQAPRTTTTKGRHADAQPGPWYRSPKRGPGRLSPTQTGRLILQNPNSVPPPPSVPPSREGVSYPGVGRCRCSTAKQHQPPPHEPDRHNAGRR